MRTLVVTAALAGAVATLAPPASAQCDFYVEVALGFGVHCPIRPERPPLGCYDVWGAIICL